MNENRRFFWMRLKEDFFTSKRIKKLRKLGADYLIIYLKMQVISLKNDGILRITGIEKTVADEVALEIDEDPDQVQLTLSYLQACGLLEVEDNGDLFLPYVQANVGSETASTLRSRVCREKQKLLQCNTDATKCNTEKEIEKEKEYTSLYRDVVEHLNKMTGKNYKASSEKTKKLIHARLKEGFTLEDFKTVIDIKCAEWLHDEKMETYLRPETLFGTKFEGYLNQKGGKNDRRGEKGLESGMASEVPWSVFRGDFD